MKTKLTFGEIQAFLGNKENIENSIQSAYQAGIKTATRRYQPISTHEFDCWWKNYQLSNDVYNDPEGLAIDAWEAGVKAMQTEEGVYLALLGAYRLGREENPGGTVD